MKLRRKKHQIKVTKYSLRQMEGIFQKASIKDPTAFELSLMGGVFISQERSWYPDAGRPWKATRKDTCTGMQAWRTLPATGGNCRNQEPLKGTVTFSRCTSVQGDLSKNEGLSLASISLFLPPLLRQNPSRRQRARETQLGIPSVSCQGISEAPGQCPSMFYSHTFITSISQICSIHFAITSLPQILFNFL